MNEHATLGTFGKAFQEKFVQACLTDERFAESMHEVFDVAYIDLKHLQFLTKRLFDYASKYKVYPSLPMLVTIIKDELKAGMGSDVVLRDQIIEYLRKMQQNADLNDLPFIKEKSLEFCRKQALRKALENAVDKMEANKYESIVEEIKKAVLVGTAPQLGHEFFVDHEARFTKLARNTIPSCIPQLNDKTILDGGYGAGELIAFLAPTGVFKSHMLVAEGCNALDLGKNVVHYTFELSETRTGVRYDSNLCRIDSNDVIDRKDDVLKMYEDRGGDIGKLYIKYLPPNTATVYTLRAHLERLTLKGFRPHMIIVDYADLMRSTRQFDSLRHELKLVYEELRALAEEMGVPILTASQTNREGSEQDVIDTNRMGEAYGKAQTADAVISISRKMNEKASGIGRLYVAKNRAGRDGILFPVRINTAQSRIEVIGDEMTPAEHEVDVAQDVQKALRDKWNKVKQGLSLEDVSQASTSSS